MLSDCSKLQATKDLIVNYFILFIIFHFLFRLSKEMNDLATYCPERRAADKFEVTGSYFIMSEVAEVASAMLDAKLVSMFKKFPEAIDTIHFSDQVILASHWSILIT